MVFSSSENEDLCSSDGEAKLSDMLSDDNNSRPNTLVFPSKPKPIHMKTQGSNDKTLLRVIKTHNKIED